MRVVIAPDKFAGTLSAAEAASAIAVGWRSAAPGDDLILAPMSDGGPGFLDTVSNVFDGVTTATVEDPLSRGVPASWLQTDVAGTRIAVIESAEACGLSRLTPEELDPRRTTSYGVGQLISIAVAAGARRILIGLGGSASNDGGAGMAQALGVRLLDADGNELPRGGAALAALRSVDASRLDPRLAGVDIVAVSDVDNPLLGPNGATRTFGAQKGADDAALDELVAALENWVEVLGAPDDAAAPGAGAAGGLGFALMHFCAAAMEPGLRLVANIVGLRAKIADADVVVTGEGRFDSVSLHGKVPAGVAEIALEASVPCLVLAGDVTVSDDEARAIGVHAAYSIMSIAGSTGEAFAQPAYWLEKIAAQAAREWTAKLRGTPAEVDDSSAPTSPNGEPSSDPVRS